MPILRKLERERTHGFKLPKSVLLSYFVKVQVRDRFLSCHKANHRDEREVNTGALFVCFATERQCSWLVQVASMPGF